MSNVLQFPTTKHDGGDGGETVIRIVLEAPEPEQTVDKESSSKDFWLGFFFGWLFFS